MLWIYRLLFLPVLLLLAPRYLWRMRRRGGYRAGFSHRFGAWPELPPRRPGVRRVWLQAVSVGEMLAIGPLLDGLAREGAEVLLTTTTSTGHELARDRYAGRVIGIGYFPLDWWWFSRRAWARINPDLAIIMEGERWPEHLRQAARRGVRVICVNARISDRGFRRMKKFPAAARAMLDGLARVLPGSTPDEARFRELGVPAGKLFTTGNLKLDLDIAPLGDAEKAALRRELGLPAAGLVLLGSSTWPGEEAALLGALRAARAGGAACALLLVPRHAERRGEIGRLLGESGLRFHMRSRGAAAGEVDVAVGDTTGELRRLTQLADLVFCGKSLAPNEGGQTPVEAAALEKPLLFGPAMSNFRAIARELVERGAAREVADAAGLGAAGVELLRDDPARARMASAAAAWHRENRGAAERTLAVLREELGRVSDAGEGAR